MSHFLFEQEDTFDVVIAVKSFTFKDMCQSILVYFLLACIIFKIPDACHYAANCSNSSRTSDGTILDTQPTERNYEIEVHADSTQN